MKYTTNTGTAHPLGATVKSQGVNFSIFSQDGNDVELLLFDHPEDATPSQVIYLDPIDNHTFHFWHVFVEGVKPGMGYGYRIGGEYNPANGFRFNRNKVIVDPYTKGLNTTYWNRADACGTEDNLHTSMRSIVVDYSNYDWEGDKAPETPIEKTVVYEMHVGGFTLDKSSGVKAPGTFAGLIEKIPYLVKLGITAVELLPVFQFDPEEVSGVSPDGQKLSNYWGYSTLGFFTPHSDYCTNPSIGKHIEEFRDLVKALHHAGLEVILDVVFNHSGEGNHEGPAIHFRNLDNRIYYFLSYGNEEYYENYSGCGNTINCNEPVVKKFIIDCLEFWVKEMHVDGFRFDEGSIMSRGEDGAPMEHPPVIWELELSDTFANTKLFTEAWDAAGLYQVGRFPGYRWSEWNGKFRDDIRNFVKGTPGFHGAAATRIAGSGDLYFHDRHSPMNGVNFISCHDGFTAMDTVSYNEKHNWANGEGNQDGMNENFSWNCGVEGDTDNEEVLALRNKQIKNLFTLLLISKGIPMILMGDEVGRTQHGNNNAYCHNNELSWFNWNDVTANKDLLDFVSKLIKFRLKHGSLSSKQFFTGEVNSRGLRDIEWHGCALNGPGWDNMDSKLLAFTIGGMEEKDSDLHVMMNFDSTALGFEIPQINDGQWTLTMDTSLAKPFVSGKVKISQDHYIVNPYSIVILTLK